MAHFAEALDGGGPLPVTSADARRALELVTAIYQSSDTGADVALPIGAGQPEIRRLAGRDPLSRGETPMATSVVLDKVVKHYGTVPVIHGIDLRDRPGRVRGLRRPVRLRQVHAAAHDRRARGDLAAARCCSTASG